MTSEEEALRQTFFLECEELVASAEQSVEALRAGNERETEINALFRAVHSTKGGAGAFGLERLAKFAHAFESFMDLLRKGRADLDETAIDLLFECIDVLRLLVDEAKNGTPVPADRHDAALSALRSAADIGEESHGGSVSVGAVPAEPPPEGASAPLRRYRIRLVPGTRLLAAGVDPLRILRGLRDLGNLSTEIDAANLPTLNNLDPLICHFRWTVTLESSAPRSDLDDIVDMFNDLAAVEIEDLTPPPTASEPKPVDPTAVAMAKERSEGAQHGRKEKQAATVRVDVTKLERLGNMVGELIITQAFLARQTVGIDPEKQRPLFRALDEMSQHIRDLADAATSIRAQPLKVVFQRFGALIRDLEKSTSKQIRLEVTGEGTEIDKTVVDRLSEPLTHLIRNSIDHGIEPTDARISAGKDPVGNLRLTAQQRGTHVVIELSDDGGGINRTRVLSKAIERGLVAPGTALSDQEIDELVFLPGFSTAEAVTSVSGRGVGMDAVRQAITEMGGQVSLTSKSGQGTTFQLLLPLSLAILDAIVTSVGAQNYLIATNSIVESLRPSPESIIQMGNRTNLLSWRGAMLRIISLGEEFSIDGSAADPTQAILVIAKQAGSEMIAIQVDDLIGKEAVVVKSLDKNYRKVNGISSATILGDGRPALILDLPTLGTNPRRREHHDARTLVA